MHQSTEDRKELPRQTVQKAMPWLCSLQEAQALAAGASSQVADTVERVEALANAQRDRAARNELIQRTLVPLQQEVDKISMLLLGMQDALSMGLPQKEKSL